MVNKVLEQIKRDKVIAIVRGIPSDRILDLAEALYGGGITCIEVTFDQSNEEKRKDTCAAIRCLKERLGEQICIGAGTVLSVQQVQQASEAGAEYIISPNVDEEVIYETKRLEMVSIPGALTPSEVVKAHQHGADIVKLFPAGELGPGYIKAVKTPLPHIPVTAVGGVNPENCASFIKAGAIGVGCGGNLVSAKLVQENRLDKIKETARQYKKALEGFR